MELNKTIFALSICFLIPTLFSAQENTVASGSEITGVGGTVSQSIGQVSYISASNNSVTVSQGVQQVYLITDETGLGEKRISLEATAFPNPTSGGLTLKTEQIDFSDLNYSVSDLNGRILREEKIISSPTSIPLDQLANGSYFIAVYKNKQQIKSFKIVKTQ